MVDPIRERCIESLTHRIHLIRQKILAKHLSWYIKLNTPLEIDRGENKTQFQNCLRSQLSINKETEQ